MKSYGYINEQVCCLKIHLKTAYPRILLNMSEVKLIALRI